MDSIVIIFVAIVCSVLSAGLAWFVARGGNQKQVSALDQKLALAEQTITTSERMGREYQATIQQLRNELEAEEGACKTANESASSLKAYLESSKEKVDELEVELQGVKDELSAEREEHVKSGNEVSRLNAAIKEREGAEAERAEQMLTQFKNMATEVLADSTGKLKQGNAENLDNLLKPFSEKIKGFQDRVNEINTTQSENATRLKTEIDALGRTSLTMAQEAKDLSRALKGDNKVAGNWGEALLEKTLQLGGLLKDKHYTRETAYKNEAGSTVRTDFVIKLPNDQNIVIDSKMSLEAWSNAVAATEEEDVRVYMASLVTSMRTHIDGLAKKDYSEAVGDTPEFVLMFVGVEPAFYQSLQWDTGLWEYAYNKGVVLVSHTTLLPLLRTIENLWTNHNAGKQAEEIAASATSVYNGVVTVVERVNKMASSLNAASGHYEKVSAALVGQQGLMGKVEKFTAVSSAIKKEMPSLEGNRMHFSDARMEALPIEYKEDAPALTVIEGGDGESGVDVEGVFEEEDGTDTPLA